MKKIQDADVSGKKVLLRVDFNVGIENGKAKEKFKIQAAKESLAYLLSKNAKVGLLTYLGRPGGKIDPNFSLGLIVDNIASILGIKIKFVPDCIGEKVKIILEKLGENEAALLENARFYPGEDENDKKLSREIAENFDMFVNDSFSQSHRDQASITGITECLPSYAGMRLQKEIFEMEKIKSNFSRPAVAIIGGAKIETKLPVIKFFEEKYDNILVGGKIANEALDQKIKFSEKVILPVDFAEGKFDVGPETIEKFKKIISGAKTIVWNGPTGKFEEEQYAKSSKAVLGAICQSSAYSVVGGGETIEVLEKYGAMEKISFVSTGGGAMLTYLGGEKMPGIEVLR